MNTEDETRRESPEVLRRPIQARNTRWAAGIARRLAASGLRPNHISMLSMVFGALAGVALWMAGRAGSAGPGAAHLIAAAVSIQLRLLCNLFDGMVAIEGGFKTKSGEVFNELPDRFSDLCLFLAAAYTLPGRAWMPELGWSAALLSVLTAYVRAFGGAAGASQHFCGPMAKQQRMAVMTAACAVAALLAGLGVAAFLEPVYWALWVVAAGCVATIVRRIARIIRDLESG